MFWVLIGIGYLVAVGSIMRFFQFVSDTDRTIDSFWKSKNLSPRTRARIANIRSSSAKITGHRRRVHRSQGALRF